ncbi:MAG: SDR family oxidoreductase [SAR324 cluster bacterium]|nr:SDR family oxidoreductase [SAR324 cluster bacterium]
MPSKETALKGKIAVITGSTQGLGASTARLFAERGAAGLIICGRNQVKGESVAAEISSKACPTHFVQADLAKVEDCRKVIAEADRHFSKVHALVNCAAVTDRGTILNTSEELFDRMMAINTRAPFFLMQDTIKIMLREKIQGTIVNIQSMSAHGGQPFISVYCTSKGALSVLTKNVAYSLLRNRIRVNGLNIGWMDTPGEDSIQKNYHGADDSWLQKAESQQPYERLIKVDEVARTIAYLSSEESGMMTGSIIDFDQSVLGCYDGPAHPDEAMSLE